MTTAARMALLLAALSLAAAARAAAPEPASAAETPACMDLLERLDSHPADTPQTLGELLPGRWHSLSVMASQPPLVNCIAPGCVPLRLEAVELHRDDGRPARFCAAGAQPIWVQGGLGGLLPQTRYEWRAASRLLVLQSGSDAASSTTGDIPRNKP